MLTTLAVSNYRSLRDFVMPLGQLNLITGANGSGKSNVYRALRLLAETAKGSVIASLAREGGFESSLWAGDRGRPVRMQLGFASDSLSYSIDLGLPIPAITAFDSDPEIKRECIWHGAKLRPSAIAVDRRGPSIQIREEGGMAIFGEAIPAYESMVPYISDPVRAPEPLMLREQVRSWRFYDHFRTDTDAPARQPQLGSRTPVLSHDGHDLAAALQTIVEIGNGPALEKAIDDAFNGAKLTIDAENGRFITLLQQGGLNRPLSAAELSDGTLRYLFWTAALLTPRPPRLMILNEPETSLHPDLLAPLGRLISAAAANTQVIVVSHAAALIEALEDNPACLCWHLEKKQGETHIAGLRELDKPAWSWPAR